DWLLPLIVVAAGLFLLHLVWTQFKEETPPRATIESEPLELSAVPPEEIPRVPDGNYHDYPRLCDPAPAAAEHRSLYTWRDEAGTLNLSDRLPAVGDFRATVIALDWAEWSFKLDLSLHHSSLGKLPVSFETLLRAGAYAIIRSLAYVSGQRRLVP